MPTPIDPSSQMLEFLMWLVGISIGIIGTIIGAFRKLAGRILEGDAELHKRVNKVRAEFLKKEDYREDSANLAKTFEREIAHVTEAMKTRDEEQRRESQLIIDLLKESLNRGN